MKMRVHQLKATVMDFLTLSGVTSTFVLYRIDWRLATEVIQSRSITAIHLQSVSRKALHTSEAEPAFGSDKPRVRGP